MPEASARARVAVFLSGTGSNMAALLYASRIPDAPFEIVMVASNNPDAAGLTFARAEGVPTFVLPHKDMPRVQHDAAMSQAARESGAEYIALAGYMRILGPEIVAEWAGRMLNIHPSLLPEYKGLDTHARALAAGDRHAGCSIHLVSEELDGGEVLGQMPVAILPGDTPASLAARVLLAEHQLYPRVLAEYVSRGRDPAHLLARVRKLALDLPHTHERDSHGAPGWRVGSEKSGKYFAYFNDRHHGTGHVALLVKTGSMDELLDLVEAQPGAYFKPAYYGASGWIGVILDRPGLDWEDVADWLSRSWLAVAPQSVSRQLISAGRD